MTDAERAAFWRGKRVLVTGGAGFLGSALCHALAELGARVTALDACSAAAPTRQSGRRRCGLVRGDIREVDLHSLCEGASVIFNLAAQTSHMGGQADPLADIAVNAVAQVRLIQAAREAAPEAVVVHASTRQFYGRPLYLPVDENQPVSPPDANGVSKFAGEQYWMLEHRTAGRPVVSLRLTNCYGPRLRIRDARQTFLGIWIRCVLEERPFEVWGGEQLRDLTYVDDVTDAFLRAASHAGLPRQDLQHRRPAAGLAARDRQRSCASRRHRCSTSPANSPLIAHASTSAATTPTTALSAPPPAGRRKSRWRRASAALHATGTRRGLADYSLRVRRPRT